MATWLKALMIPCPVCGARPHKPCVNMFTQKPLKVDSPHQTRIEFGMSGKSLTKEQ